MIALHIFYVSFAPFNMAKKNSILKGIFYIECPDKTFLSITAKKPY